MLDQLLVKCVVEIFSQLVIIMIRQCVYLQTESSCIYMCTITLLYRTITRFILLPYSDSLLLLFSIPYSDTTLFLFTFSPHHISEVVIVLSHQDWPYCNSQYNGGTVECSSRAHWVWGPPQKRIFLLSSENRTCVIYFHFSKVSESPQSDFRIKSY